MEKDKKSDSSFLSRKKLKRSHSNSSDETQEKDGQKEVSLKSE